MLRLEIISLIKVASMSSWRLKVSLNQESKNIKRKDFILYETLYCSKKIYKCQYWFINDYHQCYNSFIYTSSVFDQSPLYFKTNGNFLKFEPDKVLELIYIFTLSIGSISLFGSETFSSRYTSSSTIDLYSWRLSNAFFRIFMLILFIPPSYSNSFLAT